MTRDKHRTPVPDRARRRAVRALAARLGVPYSVAARLLRAQVARRPEEFTPSAAAAADEHRAWMFAVRERRRFAVRVRDTRQAADLPLGRAQHLTERFPPMRDPAPGSGHRDSHRYGGLYGGRDRAAVLGVLYAVVAVETPGVLPRPTELDWVAELGEESAVDVACAAPDRAARLLLDGDRWRLWTRVEAALAAAIDGDDRRLRDAARTLDREFRTVVLRHSVDGARQILDAVLAGVHAAHAPGTRARLLGVGVEAGAGVGVEADVEADVEAGVDRGVDGAVVTVVGVRWAASGPPTGYEVRGDTGSDVLVVCPEDVEPLPGAPAPLSGSR